MEIEFIRYECGVLAIHPSNGAILGSGKTRIEALASVLEAVQKAMRDVDEKP